MEPRESREGGGTEVRSQYVPSREAKWNMEEQWASLPLSPLKCSLGDIYSTRTKGFVRCPFYTKSAHIHHPLTLRNIYENQRKFVLALENL